MPRNRVRSTVPVFLAALAVLALAICLGLAKFGPGDLLGSARAAGVEGAVAAYSFDEGQGATVEDLTGNGHTGTIEGATWTPRGKFGSALKFNGEACVHVPDSADLEFSEEFTLEAWVKPEGGNPSDPIIVKETGGNFTYALANGFFKESTLEGAIAYEPNVSTQVEAPYALPQNVWSHAALTFDGARMRLYVDGEEVASQASAPPITSKDRLAIGCHSSWEGAMTGKIDEVRLYDRALSGSEIGEDMATPIATPPSGPVAAYAFDEGEGTAATDASGNEHTATIEGANWARGRYGSALQFDGQAGTLVSTPDSPQLDFAEEFTLEAWVRPDEANEWSAVITKEREGGLSYQLHAEGEHGGPEGFPRRR